MCIRDRNYTIRFQNIGTDTAFQVVIRDTLDDNLTIGTFSPGVSSHDYDWQITEEGILEFIFSNIQLCLLYTSDAADERSSVDLGGRRIIKKKKKKRNNNGTLEI